MFSKLSLFILEAVNRGVGFLLDTPVLPFIVYLFFFPPFSFPVLLSCGGKTSRSKNILLIDNTG